MEYTNQRIEKALQSDRDNPIRHTFHQYKNDDGKRPGKWSIAARQEINSYVSKLQNPKCLHRDTTD